MARILIVEDHFIEANNLRLILKRAGYEVCSIAQSVPSALKIMEARSPDLVLLDIQLQGPLTGIDLARILKQKNIAFVYLSANSDKTTLDEAKATQPNGFLVKPFREKDVLVTLDIAWYIHEQQKETQERIINSRKSNALSLPRSAVPFIAASKPMLGILESIRIVGPSDTSVLIIGESGTGKELVAKSIFQHSLRADKPFVVVNCAALPASLIESELFGYEKGAFTGAETSRMGKFEMAHEGTVFLDEIGELPRNLQAKFLRVLQEREVERLGGKARKINIRVIAATNRNLEEEVASGRFRLDLYYRLNVFPIDLPALRDRKEDIEKLAGYFVKKYARDNGKNVDTIAPAALRQLQDYDWPGNIRELEHLIERTVLQVGGNIIDQFPGLQPEQVMTTPVMADGRMKSIEENERDHIVAVIKQCKGKIYGRGGAAEVLKISVPSLNARIKKLGINKKDV